MRRCIPQRIFLPQHRDAYFAAVNANGTRAFNDAELALANEPMRSTHIIEYRMVSQSHDRTERFEEVNLELVRESDVLITLQRADAEDKGGGTADLIERARARHRPLLEITVSVRDGRPSFSEKWHPNKSPAGPKNERMLDLPGIPPVLQDCTLTEGPAYAEGLKKFSARKAKSHQWFFVRAALFIVGAHVTATVISAVGLAFHVEEGWRPVLLLFGEALLLLGGLIIHRMLHHSKAARQWATARLISEVSRSVIAMSKVRGYLGQFFSPPLPEFLRPVLRTLDVFHLETTRDLDNSNWSERPDEYVHNRLTRATAGQIAYYQEQCRKAGLWLGFARGVFYTATLLAIAASLMELFIECRCHWIQCPCAFIDWLEAYHLDKAPAFMAIILPVIAVAAVSLAASLDLEARKFTYEEMVHALEKQKRLIEHAKSEHEFGALVVQTETRLLAENVNWFSRRVFTGVT